MPNVRMPDGTEVAFPDEMPEDGIRALIASKFPDEAAKIEDGDPDEVVKRGTILPMGKTRGGELVPALPEIIEGPRKTIMDLLEGKRTAQDISGKEIFELGGLFAGGGGATGTTRGIARAAGRGKPEPAPAASEGAAVAAAGERLGVDLPMAATSDSPSVQQVGKIASQVPVGGAPLREASQTAINQLEGAATRTQEAFGSGQVPIAGARAKEGLTDFIQTKSKERVEAEYAKVDELINPEVQVPLTRTRDLAIEIAKKRDRAAITQPSDALSRIAEAVKRNGMDYHGIKDLRSYIGELLDTGVLPADLSRSELKRIYGSLTDDLRVAVRESGGEAGLKAWERANSYAAAVAKRREALARILGAASDEGIFARLMTSAGSNSRADIKLLIQARRSVDNETWDEIASGVIAQLGRSPAAGGGPDRLAAGTFSPEKFVTAWNKLTPHGKNVLFRSTGKKEHADALDDIAAVSTRMKRLQQFANPSGTGQTLIGAGLGAGFVADPMTALTSIVGARVVSHILAKPRAAKAVAEYGKAAEQAARTPGKESTAMLKQRAKALAAALSVELGVEASRSRFEEELASGL